MSKTKNASAPQPRKLRVTCWSWNADMYYLWCITKDWDSPADGERWHKAKSEETATTAGVRHIRKNTHHYVGEYLRFISKKDGSTVVDFGNHMWFILIKKGEAK